MDRELKVTNFMNLFIICPMKSGSHGMFWSICVSLCVSIYRILKSEGWKEVDRYLKFENWVCPLACSLKF